MNDQELNIIVNARDQASAVIKKVQAEMGSAVGGIKNYLSDAAEASGKFARALGVGGGGVAAAAAGFIGYGAQVAGNLESWKQGFVTLLGSTEQANAAIKQIQHDAATTPFEMTGLVQANMLLTSVTHNAGASEDLLLNVGKALAAAGKGQPELDRVVVNLQQIGSLGHAQLTDIKQFAVDGIPIFDMLSKATGKSGDALSQFISDGGVTFQMLTDMFKKAGTEGGQFANAFTSQAGTFNQLVSNMKDNFNIFAADVVTKTGIFDMLKDGISRLVDFMSQHQDDMVRGIQELLGFIQRNAPVVVGIILGALVPAFVALAGSIGMTVLTLSPWAVAGAALAVILKKLVDEHGGLANALKDLRQRLGEVAGAVEGYLGPKLQALWNTVKNDLVPAFDHFWHNVIEPIIPVLGTVLVGALGLVIDGLNGLLHAAMPVNNFLSDHSWVLWGVVTVLGAIKGALMLKDAFQALKTGFSLAADSSAVSAGKMVASFAWTATKASVHAAAVTASWVASAAKTSFVWVVTELPKLVVSFAWVATKAVFHAADTSLAWVINAVRVSLVWTVTEMPKLIASFASIAAKAVIQAAATSASWIASAAATSFAWVVTELPKIIGGFIANTASAVAQGALTSAAWVASASASAAAWVVTELPRIIAAFVATAGSAAVQATAAAASWVASAATATASYQALAALVATPMVMPAIAVGAAIAALAAVQDAANKARVAVEGAQTAANTATTSNQAVIQRLNDLIKNGTPDQKARAKASLQQLATHGSFASGGFTGRGGTNEVAGVVHKGEYVVPQSQVDQATGKPKVLGGQTVNNYLTGTFNFSSQEAVDEFFKRLDRTQQLAQMGLAA